MAERNCGNCDHSSQRGETLVCWLYSEWERCEVTYDNPACEDFIDRGEDKDG